MPKLEYLKLCVVLARSAKRRHSDLQFLRQLVVSECHIDVVLALRWVIFAGDSVDHFRKRHAVINVSDL